MADRRKIPSPPHLMPDGRTFTPAMIDWIAGIASDEASAVETNIGSQLSGVAAAVQNTTIALTQEVAARVAGVAAVAGAGDGTAVSNSGVYSNLTVTSATWVQAVALLVTPTGPPGSYAFSIFADGSGVADPSITVSDNGTFNGAWRIVEKRVSDSAETVIDSGTFTAVWNGEEIIVAEGSSYTIPAGVVVTFTGLPETIAATYSTTQTEVRFDLSRASGSNTVTGLSGSFAVTWSA